MSRMCQDSYTCLRKHVPRTLLLPPGCILLNMDMNKLVLVKCWKGNSRGLPKGKINEGELASAAAAREVLEETGFDASALFNEKDFLTVYRNGQQTTMFIVTGVDEGFLFHPQVKSGGRRVSMTLVRLCSLVHVWHECSVRAALPIALSFGRVSLLGNALLCYGLLACLLCQVRKEISSVEWFPLDSLPKGSYGVEPFMPGLQRWIAKSKGQPAPKCATAGASSLAVATSARPFLHVNVKACRFKSSFPVSPGGDYLAHLIQQLVAAHSYMTTPV